MTVLTYEERKALIKRAVLNGGYDQLVTVTEQAVLAKPVDMVLYCPKCNTQHIDAPDLCPECPGGACMCVRQRERWTNPPHRSHLCACCGHIWRPSDTATNGVARTESGKDADTVPARNSEYVRGGES